MPENEREDIMQKLGIMHGDIRRLGDDVKAIRAEMYGDGSDDNPGIKGRIMKQEQFCRFTQDAKEKGGERRWGVWLVLIGALVTIATDIVMRLFF